MTMILTSTPCPRPAGRPMLKRPARAPRVKAPPAWVPGATLPEFRAQLPGLLADVPPVLAQARVVPLGVGARTPPWSRWRTPAAGRGLWCIRLAARWRLGNSLGTGKGWQREGFTRLMLA